MDNSKRSGQETHTPREKVLGYVYRVFSSTTLAARQSLPWKSSWYYQTVLRKAKYCPISTSDHKVQGEISLNAHRKGCIIVHCAFKCHDSCLLNYPSYCEPHYNELQGQPHFFFLPLANRFVWFYSSSAALGVLVKSSKNRMHPHYFAVQEHFRFRETLIIFKFRLKHWTVMEV